MQLFKTSSILRNVLDSAKDVSIIATDPNLIVKVFNVGAEHLLGYTSEEVVDRMTPGRMHDRAELDALCAKVATEVGRPLKEWEVFVQPEMLGRAQDCTFVRRDGAAVKVSQVVNAMFTYEGELIGYLSIGHDVTRQREYEHSLREATSRAEQANRAKSDFLANMSHEIRTPMNAVIGLSYLLRNTALDARQSGFLTNIETASKSLLAIINDVLDLSKIEAGELMVEKTPFNPRHLVNEVVDVMRLYADAKGIEFKSAMPAELPATLDGDPTRLKQILTNLLSNAIRFTDHGGVEVRVVLDTDEPTQVGLAFIVKDTGIGIAPAAQARLFMPFAQADASITRRYGGTGLGLSIVKSLVKVLGGKLELDSTSGVGSTFTVRLVFARTLHGVVPDPVPQLVAPGHLGLPGVNVLVVDDSDMNLDVVKYILELEGACVALARNGQEALDRLQTDALEFDVVLMDVQMPVMDGHAATRLIRGELGLVDLPIIALTAGALSSERDRAVAAGMDDFLIKPFDPAALVRCIRRHVDAASVAAGTPIAGTAVATVAAPEQNKTEWPQIDGIDSADAKRRLSNDCGLFLSSLARLLVEFSDVSMPVGASKAGDLAELAAQMHKLKGNAGTLGANAIHSLAAEAESACLADSVERTSVLVSALAIQLRRLRDSAAPVISAARARTLAADAAAPPSAEKLSSDLIGELVHLLRQHNLAALDRFRQIGPQLRQHLGPATYEIVRDHVDSLQFNEAAALLEAAATPLVA
jgi:PAS domain S-box-containing protein